MTWLGALLERLLSVRALLLAAVIALVVTGERPAPLGQVDAALLRVGTMLVKPAGGEAPAAVAVPPALWARFVDEPQAETEVFELIEALIQRGTTVALVQRGVGAGQPTRAQTYLARVQARWQQGDAPELGAELAAYEQRRRQWASWRRRGQLRLGVPAHALTRPPGERWLLPVAASARPELAWLSSWRRPAPPVLSSNMPARAHDPDALPIARPSAGRGQPLLWRHGEGAVPSLVLALLHPPGDTLSARWLPYRGVELAGQLQSLSPEARYLPLYGPTSAIDSPVPVVALAKAREALPSARTVVLGAVDDPLLPAVAGALASMQRDAYAWSPLWWLWLEPALLALALLFLLLAVPRLRTSTAVLLGLLLLLGLAALQLAGLLLSRYWLPVGVAMQLLLVGGLLMYVAVAGRRRLQHWRQRADEAHFKLGDVYYRQGKLDEALLALSHCDSNDHTLNLYYDIAAQQERKRQYHLAAATYQQIADRRRGYKDAAKRAQKLSGLTGENTAVAPGNLAATATLVLPDGEISKPVLGRYEIQQELGRGAMGVVYLGRDPKISRLVAIKTLAYSQLDPGELGGVQERFFREAEAAGRLNHPNIVTVYDVGEEDDLAFIAMDYLEGKPLNHYTKAGHLLPVPTVYEIIAQVADALDYAHGQNIVHRDIKPSNIIYNPNSGQVKVTDFGIARITDHSKTKTGDILGSPLYMSPEQLKGLRAEGRTDIYSLGVTLYQLLTGELPYFGDNIANLAYEIINKKYRSVRELRPELPASAVRIVNKAMQKTPGKRYASAGEMAVALRKSLRRDFDVEAG